jgi:hypothetical protein
MLLYGLGSDKGCSMRKELRELVQELTDSLSALATAGDYGSVSVYASFLQGVTMSFAEVLLGQREEITPEERHHLEQMLHNPLIRSFATRQKIEQQLTRCGRL